MPRTVPYPVGWPVLYKGTEAAVVEAVHLDASETYYTITLIPDGREVQTVSVYVSSWIDDKDAEYVKQKFETF